MLHARPPLVFHRVLDRLARVAGLLRVVVVAFPRPSIREKCVELGGAAAQPNDRRHIHVGQRDVHVKAADESEPAVSSSRRLSGFRDGCDRR